MTGPSLSRVGALLIGLVTLTLGLNAQTPGDTRVNAAFNRLESDLMERLNVSESLSPGREDLALLMRKDAAVARSWQIEPSLAAMMTTDEIFRFVVARANALLTCQLAQLAGRDLAAAPRDGRAAAAARGGRAAATPTGAFVSQRLWRGNLTEGNFKLSPGCKVLLDKEGQPASLTTKEEVAQSDRLMNRSLRPTSRAQLFEAAVDPDFRQGAEARLAANLSYLRREYGGPPEREMDIEAIIGHKEAQVFSRQVLMFEAFVSSTANADRLILLVPLSE
jgi:hypothetical protein